MRELVFYLYNGQVPLIDSMAIELLPLADRFQLDQLKQMTGQVFYLPIFLLKALKI